ncbi:matrix protein [Bat paramyxovirus]|uniref:matrix protein n=1 Tax=Bat paramyxovirus TaxID=1300978 RepID=UPI0005FC9DB0|nr:matrix protein [Bat paramyxovirus]AIF74188.1 matrix protein [Bat paramyxovirus]
MEGIASFHPNSWEEGGTLEAFEPEVDDLGKLVPKVKVVNPGWNDRKSTGYMYLIVYGIIEGNSVKPSGGVQSTATTKKSNDPKTKGKVWCVASFPLGVGRSHTDPDKLLEAITELKITVRRTAGYDEKIVFGTTNISPELRPWEKILTNGAIFSALKVCSHVEMVPLDVYLHLRPVFLTITKLTDSGVYKVPRNILEFRYQNAISFNLLIELTIGADLSGTGIKGKPDENGNHITTFMVHVGNFARKRGKIYSADYCRQKVERMGLKFSLGAIGGLSLHVKVSGKMSKTLHAQLGYRKQICYSLMDTNPFLNKLMWKYECSITKVSAVFQPSVPRDFMMYDDILIDHTGKILVRT